MDGGYYKVTIYIKDRSPLGGVRYYPTTDNDVAYELAKKSILKFYYLSDILKIDIWPVPEYSDEVKAYLKKQGKLEP